MIIGLDFDGTCVTHEYPKIGMELPNCANTLYRLTNAGHKLILWTMRSNSELQEAVEWFQERNIPLYAINRNPTQASWTQSPKAFCHLYIDDAALGAPLANWHTERPSIDWGIVENWLSENGYFGAKTSKSHAH